MVKQGATGNKQWTTSNRQQAIGKKYEAIHHNLLKKKMVKRKFCLRFRVSKTLFCEIMVMSYNVYLKGERMDIPLRV